MKQKLALVSVCASLSLLVLMKPAYAYLDPGTGSMLLQGLIAAVAGGMAAAGMYWTKIKNFFSKKKNMGAKGAEPK